MSLDGFWGGFFTILDVALFFVCIALALFFAVKLMEKATEHGGGRLALMIVLFVLLLVHFLVGVKWLPLAGLAFATVLVMSLCWVITYIFCTFDGQESRMAARDSLNFAILTGLLALSTPFLLRVFI